MRNQRGTVRVGHLKARAAFRLNSEEGEELEIMLGQDGAVPFIRRVDFSACHK